MDQAIQLLLYIVVKLLDILQALDIILSKETFILSAPDARLRGGICVGILSPHKQKVEKAWRIDTTPNWITYVSNLAQD